MKVLAARASAEAIGLVVTVVVSIWIARAVGATYLGYLASALAISQLGSTLFNAGLSSAGAQAVANDPDEANDIWWRVTLVRLGFATIAVLIAQLALATVAIDPVLRGYLRIMTLAWLAVPFASEWLLVARGRVIEVSALRLLSGALPTLSVFLLIRGPADHAWLPVLIVLPAVLGALGGSLVAGWRGIVHRPGLGLVDRVALLNLLRKAVHFFKADFSIFLFTSSDRIFLYAFFTPAVVGFYHAAYRVIQPFYMISLVVTETMFLRLSQGYREGKVAAVFRPYVDLMCFATIPVGFFCAALAPQIIELLYGEDLAPAAQYLALLGWVITVGYMAGVTVTPFTAWNRAPEYGNAVLSGNVTNMALNITLIPTLQGHGAALATIASQVAIAGLGMRAFRRATDYPLGRDFTLYLTFSSAGLAGALIAMRLLGESLLAGTLGFASIYVPLVGMVRWRHYTSGTGLAWTARRLSSGLRRRGPPMATPAPSVGGATVEVVEDGKQIVIPPHDGGWAPFRQLPGNPPQEAGGSVNNPPAPSTRRQSDDTQ